MKRNTHITLGLALSTVLLTSLAGAQTSSVPPGQTSLGDYARKVRKDPEAPKAKPKLFDNDNLPKDDKLSVVGQPVAPTPAPEASDKASAPADKTARAADGKTATGTEAKAGAAADDPAKKQAEWKEWQDKLNAQKEKISLAARELDVLQREYELRAAAIYADAGNRIRNEATWDKQDAEYKQKIADKQKALDDTKQKLSDMQEEARKAGVPASMME